MAETMNASATIAAGHVISTDPKVGTSVSKNSTVHLVVSTGPNIPTVQVPAGYAPDEYRLVGKIAGQAPFSGVLVHRGWKTDMVKLPQLLPSAPGRLPAIAPAEVELK